jgi:hypothetical protein
MYYKKYGFASAISEREDSSLGDGVAAVKAGDIKQVGAARFGHAKLVLLAVAS